MLRGNRSIKVEGLVVFGVAAARCGGIAALEPRFASHFYELEVQPFSNASMISIFRGSLDACLSAGAKVEPQDLLACTPALAKLVVRLLNDMSTTFVPTPAQRDYVFDFGDVARVLGGMRLGIQRCGAGGLGTAQALLQLCVHECGRVFHDRLKDEDTSQMRELFQDQ